VTAKPPVVADLEWLGDLRFRARSGAVAADLDGDGRAALSPVQALAVALAGCMASDVVHILVKARLPPRLLKARLTAERAPEDPHRLIKVELRFSLAGAAPPDRVQRAIDLSRQTYCSVWHSLSQDIEFTTSFELIAT
jgi:putative redox protein